jgi:CIC family chloride channel protein
MFGLEDIFKAIKMPEYLKPAVGGLAVGLIGVYEAGVLGLGYGEIQQVLTGNLALWFLVLMAVLKIAATSLTLGSGGSGGIFSPSLFVGAMLGAAFSRALQSALPGDIGDPGAYAIVGMAAVFGAAARAPFTAVIVVIEMTRDYSLVLPLMASVSLAVAIVSVVSRGTIYTTSLMRRGVDIEKMDHAGN